MEVGHETAEQATDALLVQVRAAILAHIRTVPAEQDAHPSVKSRVKKEAAEAAAKAEQPAPEA